MGESARSLNVIKSLLLTRAAFLDSAGIGFGPNGMQALDLIEPGFRPLYEKICVGNKPADAQSVFFEGLLLEPGLGKSSLVSSEMPLFLYLFDWTNVREL